MDTIIRSYWVAWDNANGTDGEMMFSASKKDLAWDFYRDLSVPYKKIVACYHDHDVTLAWAETGSRYLIDFEGA